MTSAPPTRLEQIGASLRADRLALALSQTDLATRAGVSQSLVSAAERGSARAGKGTRRQLELALAAAEAERAVKQIARALRGIGA